MCFVHKLEIALSIVNFFTDNIVYGEAEEYMNGEVPNILESNTCMHVEPVSATSELQRSVEHQYDIAEAGYAAPSVTALATRGQNQQLVIACVTSIKNCHTTDTAYLTCVL